MKRSDLKLSEGNRIEKFIEVFEMYNPITQSILEFKAYANKIIMIDIAYITVIMFAQQKFYILTILTSIVIPTILIVLMYKKIASISYIHSKDIGGKKAKYIFRKEEGLLQTMTYNIVRMKEDEWKLINKILKINYLNNKECISELRDYYSRNKTNKKYEMKSFVINFLVGIVVPIILNICTYVFNDIDLEQKVVIIIYFIKEILFIFAIIVLIYMIYRIKKLSITNIYTIPRLERLLTEILLNRAKDRRN